MKILNSNFRNTNASFLVDPGSDLNLIKTGTLLPEVKYIPKNTVLLAGITDHPIRTVGTPEISIFDVPVEFDLQLVKNTFRVSSDGILGRPYLRKEQTQLSFRHNTLLTISNPITPVPFIDKESRRAKEALKSEIKPFSRILKIQARTQQAVPIDVIYSEVTEGYYPRINTPPGLYMEEAIVKNREGLRDVLAINNTDEEIDFEVPPPEVFPYDIYEFPGNDTLSSESEDVMNYPFPEERSTDKNHAERVMQSLYISHLSPRSRITILRQLLKKLAYNLTNN